MVNLFYFNLINEKFLTRVVFNNAKEFYLILYININKIVIAKNFLRNCNSLQKFTFLKVIFFLS